jgi:hypothetical protein
LPRATIAASCHDKGARIMTVFRNPMEKILDQQENETIITNPKDRTRTHCLG